MKKFFQRRPTFSSSSAPPSPAPAAAAPADVNAAVGTVPATPTKPIQDDELTLFKARVSGFASDRQIWIRLTPKRLYQSDGVVYDLLQLHTISDDPVQGQAVIVHWFRSRSNTKLIGNKVKGEMLKSVTEARDMIVIQRYVFESEADHQTMVLLLDDLTRTRWQALCEHRVITAPELYQAHTAVIKVNRKGHCQERMLVLSNLWLYNIQYHTDPIAIKQCKWAIPLQAITELQLDILQQTLSMTLVIDEVTMTKLMDQYHRMSRADLPKSLHQFCFYSVASQQAFVTQLRLLRRDQIVIKCSQPYLDEMEHLGRFRATIQHGYLVKHRKHNTTMPHRRYVRLTDSGMIAWSQEPNSAKVLSGEIRSSPGNKFDEKMLSFTIVTTSKTLHFVAESLDDFRAWKQALETVMQRHQNRVHVQLSSSNKVQFL